MNNIQNLQSKMSQKIDYAEVLLKHREIYLDIKTLVCSSFKDIIWYVNIRDDCCQLAGNSVRMMITSYGFSNVYSKTISLPITFRNFWEILNWEQLQRPYGWNHLHELYLNLLLLSTITFIILLVLTFNLFIYFSSVNTTLNYYVAKANEAHTCTCNYHPKALERT